MGNVRSSVHCSIHCTCYCLWLNSCTSPDWERDFDPVFWGISGHYRGKHEAKTFQSYRKAHHQRWSSSLPVCALSRSVYNYNYSLVPSAQIWVVMQCYRFLFHFLSILFSSRHSLNFPAKYISLRSSLLQGFVSVLASFLSWSLYPSFGHLTCWASIHLSEFQTKWSLLPQEREMSILLPALSKEWVSLLEQWAADGQMANNCVMLSITKIKSAICHIAFWGGSRKLAKFFRGDQELSLSHSGHLLLHINLLGLFFRASTWHFLKTGLLTLFFKSWPKKLWLIKNTVCY